MSSPPSPRPSQSFVEDSQMNSASESESVADTPQASSTRKRPRESGASASADAPEAPPPSKKKSKGKKKQGPDPFPLDIDEPTETPGRGRGKARGSRGGNKGRGGVRGGKGSKAGKAMTSDDGYIVEWDGKNCNDGEIQATITSLMEMGMFDNYKIDVDEEAQKAQQDAFAGFVLIDILDETAPAWHPNEINRRDIDVHQATILLGHFLDLGCRPEHNWLVASIDSAEALQSESGDAVQFSKTLEGAQRAKVTGDIWRVAGNHRMYTVREYHKTCRSGITRATSLVQAMGKVAGEDEKLESSRKSGHEAKEIYEKALNLVLTKWAVWPVAVYWRAKLMAQTEVMAKLRSRLAGNKAPHQYEGTVWESFQMIVNDPSAANRYLTQETSRVWSAPALRDLINLWIPFPSLQHYSTFKIRPNSHRIEQPWLGTWTTLVCQTLRQLKTLVTPSKEQILSEDSEDLTNRKFYGFVTPELLKVFNNAYTTTLFSVIRKEFPITLKGYVTPAWRDAFLEYCGLLIQNAPDIMRNINHLPKALPEAWYDLRTSFSDMVVSRINAVSQAASEFPEHETPIEATLPWFSEAVADDFQLLAQQAAPGMSILAEILDPAWRNFKPSASQSRLDNDEEAGIRNRRDSDYPDDSTVVIHQATLRLQSGGIREPNNIPIIFNFIARLALSPLGTAFSAKVVNLGLRRADGVEDPSLLVPSAKLTPLSKPRSAVADKAKPAWIKSAVPGYLRNKIIELAMVPSRRRYRQGDEARHLSKLPNVNDGLAWIDEGFAKWFDLVLLSSYFRQIAPFLTVEWTDHVNGLYSLWHWTKEERVKPLQILADSVEFAFVWHDWVKAFLPKMPLGEKTRFHAFVNLPKAVLPDWDNPRPHSYIIAHTNHLPEIYRKGASPDELKLGGQRGRDILKVTRTVKRNLGLASGGDGPSTSKKGSQRKADKTDASPTPDAPPPADDPAKSTSALPDLLTAAFAEYADLTQSEDEANRAIGSLMCNIYMTIKAFGIDVPRIHSHVNLALAHFVLLPCPPPVLDLYGPIRWSVLAATIALGRADKAMYLPPPPPHLRAEWTKAIEAFEAASTEYLRVADTDLLYHLAIPKHRTVGELPLSPQLLHTLRNETAEVVTKLASSGELFSMSEFALALLDRLQRLALASRASSGAAVPPPAPAGGVEGQPLAFEDYINFPPTQPSSSAPEPSPSSPPTTQELPAQPHPTPSSEATVTGAPAILTQFAIPPDESPLSSPGPDPEPEPAVEPEPAGSPRKTRSGQAPPPPSPGKPKGGKGSRGGKQKAAVIEQPAEETNEAEAGPSTPRVAGPSKGKRSKADAQEQLLNLFSQKSK